MKAAAITLVFFSMPHLLQQMRKQAQCEGVVHGSWVVTQPKPTLDVPVSAQNPFRASGQHGLQYKAWHRNEARRCAYAAARGLRGPRQRTGQSSCGSTHSPRAADRGTLSRGSVTTPHVASHVVW